MKILSPTSAAADYLQTICFVHHETMKRLIARTLWRLLVGNALVYRLTGVRLWTVEPGLWQANVGRRFFEIRERQR